jgi:signal transduction histidine kinase
MVHDPKSGADQSGPLHDPARLLALQQTGLLDTAPEEVFDRLTRLVCRLLGVPVALVSLVENNRQFFKSAVGLPEPWKFRRETPLSHSFCQHVVASGKPLLIQDASQDPLVCDNLALPDLGVVAYLGMPLTTVDGHVLGSLCAIDTEPRAWTPADALALRDLAAMTVSEISLRRLAMGLEHQVRQQAATHKAAQVWEEHAGRLEVLGQLAGGIAKDFSNVLQAVRSGVRVAVAHMEGDPAAARHVLEVVDGVADRGTAITRLLLTFARHGGLGVQRVDAVALLEELKQALTNTLSVPLCIVVEAGQDLPALVADKGELEVVLANLATHACDEVPIGGTLTLAAATEAVADGAEHPARLRPGRYVRLSVGTTGTGTSSVTVARGNEPLLTSGFVIHGTGPGSLAMAQEFAEQAGGGIAIFNEVGSGATVSLWLPCKEPGPSGNRTSF